MHYRDRSTVSPTGEEKSVVERTSHAARKRTTRKTIARELALSTVIEQPVQARIIASAPPSRTVPAHLRYERTDPFAVRIAFPAAASLDGAEVEWAFARDLLARGLLRSAGGGDVRVWPCGPHRTVLEFHAQEGVAMVQIDTPELRSFLARSYALVPAGGEGGQLDVDSDLAALLRQA